MSKEQPLRQAALKGGAYLAGRQVVSIALKFIGVMLITRALGPASYGAYVSAFNVYQYLLLLGQAGVGVYLLRYQGTVPDQAYTTAYSLLGVMSLVILGAAELGRDGLGALIGVEGFEQVATIMVLALPFQLLSVPATIKLERALNYQAVATLEIAGQLCFYALAVPLVLMGHGPVSLAFAWLLQQIISFGIAHAYIRALPRFSFHPETAKQTLRYAATFSFANWIWQLRMLVNPMIIGPALGAEAVGLVGMTIGLLEMLSIIKTIIWRLSVAILAKVQHDVERLRKAVTEGMELQLLVVGATLLGFGWTGHFIVPWLFGARWAPVMDLYPYVALSYLTVAPFNMHSATLSVLNRNLGLGVYHAVHVVVFATVAYWAVPRYGMVGYGYGELATLPVYYLMHLVLARVIGSPDYRLTALWWVASAIGLFWHQIGLWAIAVPFLALLTPWSLRKIRSYAMLILAKRRPS